MINIVERYKSAAMQRMSMPLQELLGATISDSCVEDAVNLHMPWHFILEDCKGKNVIQYTHCNPGDEAKLEEACALADLVLCMSFKGRQELLDLGVPIEKTWVTYPGAGNFPARRRNVGIVGYKQPNGRKRAHMLIDLAWLLPDEVKNILHFVIVGGGWQEIAEEASNGGLSIQHVGEKTNHVIDETLQSLYQNLDLLLVTAHVEGGPLPLLEALGAGVPVMSPEIGLAADWLDEHYTSAEDLAEKLTEFARPMLERMKMGQSHRWMDYAENVALALMPLTGESYMERTGAPRYRQLLDEIDLVKPTSICEIGTWTGDRAKQMIQVAQRHSPVIYTGFDLFEHGTPGKQRAEFSKEPISKTLAERRLRPTGAQIRLHAGDTANTLWEHDASQFDFIFIDGGHSRATIENDWNWAKQSDGVIVFDDYVENGADGYGCNFIADELDRDEWSVEHWPVVTKADDGDVSMVRVCRNTNL